MERIVLNHLEVNEDIYSRLNNNQHVFRKGCSCNSVLSSMVDELERQAMNNQCALAIFLDIRGAFDNLDPESCVRDMQNKGVPPKIVDWYSHYLLYGTVETEIKGVRGCRCLTRGTPQGAFSRFWSGT